ncbi:MAG: SPOR domain-containing protein [Treponema sp.]|nr:SPOR domain-containing protein [Treponema sp.]
MEQKKTLVIIASVGVFLLIVLAPLIIKHSPSNNRSHEIAGINPVEKIPAQKGFTKNTETITLNPQPVEVPQNLQEPQTSKVNDLVVISDNTTVYSQNLTTPNLPASEATTIDLKDLKHELLSEKDSTPQNQNINITVNIPETKKETIIDTTKTTKPSAPAAVAKADSVPAKENSNTVKTVKKAEQKTAKPEKTTEPKPKAAPKAKASTKAPAQTVTAAPKPEPKKTQFWVQVAAYSNKKGAEEARSILDENKITSDIFTYRDSKEKLYYRVRVGPYTTKSEAEYWRTKIAKISAIDHASDSYITSTTN